MRTLQFVIIESEREWWEEGANRRTEVRHCRSRLALDPALGLHALTCASCRCHSQSQRCSSG